MLYGNNLGIMASILCLVKLLVCTCAKLLIIPVYVQAGAVLMPLGMFCYAQK